MAKFTPFEGDPPSIIAALRNLQSGDKLVYHRGFLDTAPSGVATIASEALTLSNAGRVHLTQRRLGPTMFRGQVDRQNGIGPGFQYIATGV